MKHHLFGIGLLLICIKAACGGDATQAVAAGFAEYAAHGADAAWETWTRGSRLQQNEGLKEGFDKAASTASVKLGKSLGQELVRIREVSPSVKVEYYVWKFERGPLYIRFHCYNNGKQWLVSWIQCSDVLEDILPNMECCGAQKN
jgi:opacity protein-like surface antigen